MSEKPRKPRRTPLKRKTGEYSRPVDSSERRQRPSTQSTPPAPPPNQNTPLPSQQSPQRQSEKVVVVKQGSRGNNVLNIITWPFRKIVGAVTWLVRVIIEAMIRSVVSFIMWTVILVIIGALVGTYGFALIDSNLDFVQAFVLTLERIVSLGERLVNLMGSAESIQNGLPTPIPPGNP